MRSWSGYPESVWLARGVTDAAVAEELHQRGVCPTDLQVVQQFSGQFDESKVKRDEGGKFSETEGDGETAAAWESAIASEEWDQETAQPWMDAGFDPETAGSWAYIFDVAEEASAYIDAGFDDPDDTYRWHSVAVDYAEAMTAPELAAGLKKAGATLNDLEWFEAVGLKDGEFAGDPEAAAPWIASEFEPGDALSFVRRGVSLDGAQNLAASGIAPYDFGEIMDQLGDDPKGAAVAVAKALGATCGDG